MFGAVQEKLPAFRSLFILMRISALIGAVCIAALLVLFFAASEGVFCCIRADCACYAS